MDAGLGLFSDMCGHEGVRKHTADASFCVYIFVQPHTVSAGLLQRCVARCSSRQHSEVAARTEHRGTNRSAGTATVTIWAQPLLEQLHWLPVRQRIDYKLAVLTYSLLWVDVLQYFMYTHRILQNINTKQTQPFDKNTDMCYFMGSCFFLCCSLSIILHLWLPVTARLVQCPSSANCAC